MNLWCCECQRDVSARLTDGREVYPHRPDLADIPRWKCDECGNSVGTHHKTDTPTRPLGNIPSPDIKRARMHIHALRDARIVTETDCERALSWLRDNADDMGRAKERLVKADKMLGHIEALMIRASEEKSDEKRKADARASDRYKEAIIESAEAAGEYEKMRALREAAALKIGAWQTECANYRSMKV